MIGPSLPPDIPLTVEELVAVVASALVACDSDKQGRSRAQSYVRGVIRSSLRAQLPERLGCFRDTEYKCVFRMTAYQMETLRARLFPYLKVKLSAEVIEGRSRGNRAPVSVDEKIAIGLMFCGGATISSLLWGNHVVKQTVYNIFDQFICAIICSKVGEIKFPQTLEEMRRTSNGFLKEKLCLLFFHGILGALDGLAVRVKLPGRNEVENQVGTKNRKGFSSDNVQAISNAETKCTYLSVESPGGTHDATAFDLSGLGQLWSNQQRTRQYWTDPDTHRVYWIAADEAYGAKHNMLYPWGGTGLITRAPAKDSFNYHFSGGIRNSVERLVGQVYQRWGILWRPIRHPIRKVPLIVQALFQLHNFLKECGDSAPLFGTSIGDIRQNELRRTSNQQEGFDDTLYRQSEVATEQRNNRTRPGDCPIRDEITKALEDNFIMRPTDGRVA